MVPPQASSQESPPTAIQVRKSCLRKNREPDRQPPPPPFGFMVIIHAHLHLIKYRSNFTGTFCALAIHLTISSRGRILYSHPDVWRTRWINLPMSR